MLNVSVIVPIYNGERSIRKCLESIFSQQTRHTFEVLVIDNGSNDKSAEIINSFSDVQYHFAAEKRSAAYARNFGSRQAKGEYLLFVDSDVTLSPDWIEIVLTKLIKAKFFNIAMASIIPKGAPGILTYFRKKSNTFSKKDFLPFVQPEGIIFINTSTLIIKRSLYDQFNIDERFYRYEDTLLSIQLGFSHQPVLLTNKTYSNVYNYGSFIQYLYRSYLNGKDKYYLDKAIHKLLDSKSLVLRSYIIRNLKYIKNPLFLLLKLIVDLVQQLGVMSIKKEEQSARDDLELNKKSKNNFSKIFINDKYGIVRNVNIYKYDTHEDWIFNPYTYIRDKGVDHKVINNEHSFNTSNIVKNKAIVDDIKEIEDLEKRYFISKMIIKK